MRRVLVAVSALVAPWTCVACYSVPDLMPPQFDAPGSTGSDGGSSHTDAAPGVDAVPPGEDAAHVDVISAPGDASSSCAMLSPCNNNNDCVSDCTMRVCAGDPTVAPDVLSAAGGPFCTQPCCTSADCPSGTVCFASGEGGNYCVNPTWIGRGAPGSNAGALGGTTCSKASDCRSGLCSNGACQDTCCSAASAGGACAVGTACLFGTFPGANTLDQHFAAHCAVPTGFGGEDAPCTTDSDCTSGLCFDGQECMNPCRTTGDCGNPGDACSWDLRGSDAFAHCFPAQIGNLPFGSPCSWTSASPQCQSDICGTNGCTGLCFTKSDCGGYSNWTCAPSTFQLGTSSSVDYNVLVCGPP